MIRNVVFDMGNVLLRFDTRGAAAAFAAAPGDAELLHQGVFQSPWWIRMDRGGDEETSLGGMLRELPQRLWPDVRELMERWDDFLIPIDGVIALAEELGEKGYRLYLLSNTSVRFRRFFGKLPVLRDFSGLVLSFEEGLLKPEPEFYRRLFDRYALRPEECFFIDDSPPNIEAAWNLGMEGFRFRGDVDALRRGLRSAGVDVSAP